MKIIFAMLIFLISSRLFSADIDEMEKLYSCYSIRNIEVIVDYEKIQWSPQDPFVKVCAFTILVTNNNIHSIYSTRRWRSTAYCKKFINEWKNLKKLEDRKVCIAGFLSTPEEKNDKDILEEVG